MKKAFLNIISFAWADVGAWFTTLFSGILAGLSLGGGFVLALSKKYLVRDPSFIPWLILVVTLDTISGYRLAKKKYREDPINNPEVTMQTLREKLGGKAVAIGVSLVLLNAITNFEINGLPAQNSFIDLPIFGYNIDLNVFKLIYFTGACYMIFAEAKSTIKNIRGLGYNLFSSKLDKTLDQFTDGKEAGKDGN